MDGFSLITDHNLLFQSRGMFDGGTDACMFAADAYASVNNYYSSESNTENERKNKGKDSFFCDLPELGGFDDFKTNMRNFSPTFEIGSNYFDDTLRSSICAPEPQLVPTGCFGSTNVSSVNNQSATATDSPVSVPDQINVPTHSTYIKQETRTNDGRNQPLSSYEAHGSSSTEIDQFSLLIDAELFGPFDDTTESAKQFAGFEELEAMIRPKREMQAPTASSSTITMALDESVVTSSTCCSGPQDLVAADVPCSSKRKLNDPLHGAPDRLLEGIAENPLEMYFPQLTTSEHPEALTSDASTQRYRQFRDEFSGSSSVPHCAGMEFCSQEMMRSAESHEQPPRSPLILEAVPVKDLGFQKLQNDMNQMDAATKGRIRDALYRLANYVEQRHYVASTSGLLLGPSSSKRSDGWTETQTNPMDQSVAQLLLQKRPHKHCSTVPCDVDSFQQTSCNAVATEL